MKKRRGGVPLKWGFKGNFPTRVYTDEPDIIRKAGIVYAREDFPIKTGISRGGVPFGTGFTGRTFGKENFPIENEKT